MTGSTYIDFDKALNKGFKLIKTKDNPTFGLLIVTGINLGLRINDLLRLTFEDLRRNKLLLVEGKTGKKRELVINENIKRALIYFEDAPDSFYCFRSQKDQVYSTQHVNRLLKQHFNKQTTSHSLRKSFGRRVWENDNYSERSLLYLSELFNHTSVAITRRYLGIRQEELNDIYINL